MKEPMAGRAAEHRFSFSRGFLWWLNGCRRLLVLSFLMVRMVLLLPCAGKNHFVLCADGMENPFPFDGFEHFGYVGSLIQDQGSFPGGFELTSVCSGSNSFCFPSTLIGLGEISSSSHPGTASFELSNGGIVSCSLVDSSSEIHDAFQFNNKNFDGVSITSSEGPPFTHSRDWTLDGISGGSSSPHVEISPPFLDWGTNNLYTPSLAFLTVINTHNSSALHVFKPFSTDPQFYAYEFDKLSLAPGEAASIAFLFLPRLLGSLSAHVVLQTSFGGFVIHAKGIAIENPYGIEPFVGLDISSDGRLNWNLSLYNPFDAVLNVEEVTALISVSSKNTSHSAHVVCGIKASHQSSGLFSSLPNDREWFGVKSGELGLSWVALRPHEHWDVPPLHVEPIIKMHLWPLIEGKVSGVICMEFRNSTLDKANIVIVPLEAEVHGRATYNSLTGSVSVFFESHVPLDGMGLVCILSLRNSASYLLSVVRITESSKVFQVKYMEGLLLYPESVTQIALISYTPPTDSHDIPPKIPRVSSNCKLSILTNDSVSPQIEIPCKDLVHTCCRHEVGPGFIEHDESYIGLRSQEEKGKSTNARSGSLGSIIEEPLPFKSMGVGVVAEDELILRNWRFQGTISKMSVLKDHELLFPVVQIGTQFSKWITVHNPSQKPVVMQLVLNSGAIINQCKFADDSSKNTLFSRSVHIETQEGFSIAESATTEAFVHPFGSASFGPIVFCPLKQCTWRSSALIRNNLSGVEWLSLQAFGGSHSLLLLEGSEPVQKLEFSLPLPTPLNLSSSDPLHHLETSSSSCGHQLMKELYAKNTGELPLEVMKLEVSGSDCGLDGFMIHTCKGFSLAPGESMRLLISYQADFTSAVVIRDLKLAMATGVLVIPMKASFPVNMLNLCKKSFWTVLSKGSALIFAAAVSIFFIVFCALLHPISLGTEGYYVKGESSIATISRSEKSSRIHRNTRNARPIKKDEKSEEGSVISKYSHCGNDVQENTPRMKEKKDSDGHKKTTSLPPPTSTMPDISEAPQSDNLTVKVVKERGRRRKRKTGGEGLAAKLEVSSSKSGNSTPSSPLSPNVLTQKQIWPLSPDTSCSSFARFSKEHNREKQQEFRASTEARAPEPEISVKEQPTLPGKSAGRPVPSPSATFPGPGWCAPTSNLLASNSPIAPSARAPGSKLRREKAMKREEDDVFGTEFTYDIWGNHFSGHLMPKELSSKVFDDSEGDSQSFFARDPQSLMMMSSTQSVSPGHNLPSHDVDYLNQMN